MTEEFQSSALETAVTQLSRLPGVGRKTALRLALYLLRRDVAESDALGNSIINLRRGIKYCQVCHNISEENVCRVCSDPARDPSLVCVVENVRDVMSIERTGSFNGLYHVLGGVISPIDGIGPERLEISSLIERIGSENIREVILALSPTMEGDTTAYYIFRRICELAGHRPAISRLARGLAVGNELEYTDELTLGRSILDRRPFE